MNCLDGLKLIEDKSINCCVTSPPYYGLRDYGIDKTLWPAVKYYPMAGIPYEIELSEWNGCLGLEPTIETFIGHIVLIFREVKRVLRDDGTLWLNFGDSFVGTGGNRKKAVKNKLFQEQQLHNPKLIEPCILAGCPKNGIVLDPFMGSGTTATKALELQRNFLGFEINPEYIKLAEDCRLKNVQIKLCL